MLVLGGRHHRMRRASVESRFWYHHATIRCLRLPSQVVDVYVRLSTVLKSNVRKAPHSLLGLPDGTRNARGDSLRFGTTLTLDRLCLARHYHHGIITLIDMCTQIPFCGIGMLKSYIRLGRYRVEAGLRNRVGAFVYTL